MDKGLAERVKRRARQAKAEGPGNHKAPEEPAAPAVPIEDEPPLPPMPNMSAEERQALRQLMAEANRLAQAAQAAQAERLRYAWALYYQQLKEILAKPEGTPDPDQAARTIVKTLTGIDLPSKDDGSGTLNAGAAWRFEPIYSDELEQRVNRPTWLVKRMLVANQPCIVGGPKKTLKTSILVDLAISLRSKTPFLGYFDVYRPAKVAILSGESGDFTIWQTGVRVCAARGLDYAAHRVAWQFRLPRLSDPAHVAALAEGLAEHQIEAVGIDPLYLCLLSNAQGRPIDPSNLYEMGPLFLSVSEACLSVGCTPILSHHAKKSAITAEPLGLEDLAYAGVAEFARQWVLLNPREKFDPDTGTHKLWMTFGGSMGQSGVFGVDVVEGTLDEDFAGRVWDVTVIPASELRNQGRADHEERKETKRLERNQDQWDAVAGCPRCARPEIR